jgi:hypothetical protein
MNTPGLVNRPFEMLLKHEWFDKGSILITDSSTKIKVLNKPRRKWYHILLQWITFGWFRAKYTFKVIIEPKNK